MKRARSGDQESWHFTEGNVISVQADSNIFCPRLRFGRPGMTFDGMRPGSRWGFFQFERRQGQAVLSLLVFT
jgi:hypothetical protein